MFLQSLNKIIFAQNKEKLMLQINYIRQNAALVKERLAVKNFENINLVDELIALDEEIRKQKVTTEAIQANVNAASKEIGMLMGKGEKDAADAKKAAVNTWKEELASGKDLLTKLEEDFINKIL